MAIGIPPRYPNAPGIAARWPSSRIASDKITTVFPNISWEVIGRNRAPATTQQISVVYTLMNESARRFPDGVPVSTAILPDSGPVTNFWFELGGHGLWWGGYSGTGGGRKANGFFITFEFRTPEEVAAAAAGTHGVAPFAVTLFDAPREGGGALPPLDGADPWGDDDFDTNSFYGNNRFIRVLIREDLDTGGAGDAWSGEAFLAETVIHEVGHAAQGWLKELYGEDYLIETTCALFGVATTEWAPLDKPWDRRISEAAAETYKDIMFPRRRYDNRTHYRLSHDRFEDFLTLFVDYIQNPYWDYENLGAYAYRGDLSPSPGASDGYSVEAPLSFSAQPTRLLFLPDNSDVPSHYPAVNPPEYMAFQRAISTDPEGDIRYHYNFGIPEAGDPWIAPADQMTYALFNAKVDLWVNIWQASYWNSTGWFPYIAGRNRSHVNPVDNPNGDGSQTVDLSGLPAEGWTIDLAMGKIDPWHYPRPDAGPPTFHIDPAVLPGSSFAGFSGGLRGGDPTQFPWWEWVGGLRRARYPIIGGFTWPYTAPPHLTSTLTVGAPLHGVVRSVREMRVRGGLS